MTTATPAAASDPEHGAAAFARRHLRHNLLALGLDFGLFLVALSFASPSTILPAFAAHLGAPSVVIGAIPAVMTLGWYLPSLFAAGHTQGLRRKLPFVLRYALWERVPLPILAGVAFFLAEPAPGLALGLMLLLLLVTTGTGGFLMPAWMDIVGRAVPTTLRGRFFAVISMAGSAGGLAGGVATAWILGAVTPPASYGLCFLLSTLCMGLSYGALALTREPPASAPPPSPSLGAHLRRIPSLLRRDRNLSWFLGARALAALGTMAGGFYTVYALRGHGAQPWHVGLFTTITLAGQLAGSFVLGWLADRAGHRLVIAIGAVAIGGASLMALGAPSLPLFTLVFAAAGVHQAAIHVSGLNVLLEFAPDESERPVYVGLGTTMLAPVAFLAPLVAGVMVDGWGFASVFATAAAASLLGVALLLGRVRDPRHAARPGAHGARP